MCSQCDLDIYICTIMYIYIYGIMYDVATFICLCVPLAANSLACYYADVYIDVIFAWILYRYRCIDAHACMLLYHLILLLIIL